jgi:hypothetical protein
MDDERQKAFLLDLSQIMLRDLLVYRAGIEYFKRNPSDSFNGVESIMNQARNDSAVRAQLGDDFQAYLEGVLQLEKADARLALEKFLSEWFPRSAAN